MASKAIDKSQGDVQTLLMKRLDLARSKLKLRLEALDLDEKLLRTNVINSDRVAVPMCW